MSNIKEKIMKLGQAHVDRFRTAATPTDQYLPFHIPVTNF
jgi:hypothetical protein